MGTGTYQVDAFPVHIVPCARRVALKGRPQDTGDPQDRDENLQDGGLEVVFMHWGQVADECAEGEFGEAQACDVEDVCRILRLEVVAF